MEQKWANKLNNEEFNLISDTKYPLLKKGAIEKVKAQLFELGLKLETRLPGYGFKISAGENYQHLPYLVLDYPKISGPGFPFVFRTHFWWGKCISYQFIFLLGKDRAEASRVLNLADAEDKVLIGSNLWNHDPFSEEYLNGEMLTDSLKASLLQEDYLKLLRVRDIKKPEDLFEEAFGFFDKFIEVILASKEGS